MIVHSLVELCKDIAFDVHNEFDFRKEGEFAAHFNQRRKEGEDTAYSILVASGTVKTGQRVFLNNQMLLVKKITEDKEELV